MNLISQFDLINSKCFPSGGNIVSDGYESYQTVFSTELNKVVIYYDFVDSKNNILFSTKQDSLSACRKAMGEWLKSTTTDED